MRHVHDSHVLPCTGAGSLRSEASKRMPPGLAQKSFFHVLLSPEGSQLDRPARQDSISIDWLWLAYNEHQTAADCGCCSDALDSLC